jgi:uncharacterized protein
MDPIAEPSFSVARGYLSVGTAWIVAQSIKVVRNLARGRKFNFRWVVDTGGMPSSHSAGTAGVATVVGLYAGFDSVLFLLALVFTLVTMFDAASVRRSVGRQAIILNRMIDEIYAQGRFSENRLRAFLGHTPVEVLVGAVLGSTISYLICTW